MSSMIKIVVYSGDQIRLIWPITIVIFLIIIAELLIVDPLGELIVSFGLTESQISNANDWPSAIYEFIKRSVRSLAVVTSVLVSVKFLMKKSVSFTGISFNRRWVSQLLLGIFLGFVIQIFALVLMSIFGWYRIEGFLWNMLSTNVLLPALLYTFVISAETGIIEESIFRGFLMNSLADRYNLKTGVVVSSIIFGLLHFSGFDTEFPWWLSVLSSIIAGFLFCQAYLLFNNLWVPLGLHFAWHFAARTLGTPGVNLEEACFLVTNVNGPILLIVTKAGGASIFELLGMGLCSLIIFLIHHGKQGTNDEKI